MKRFSWFVFFSITAISCLDQPDCYQLNNNVAVFGFKIIGGGNDVYVLNGVHTPGTDSVLLENLTGSNNVSLPLNPYANEINYAFEGYFEPYGALETKNLNLSYEALVQFVSEDCGERHVFSGMSVISTDFDSIRILNSVPTNPPSSNFDIYRCPRTDIIYVDFVEDLAITTIKFLPDITFDVNGKIGSVLLPVNLTAKESTYVFNFSDGTADTLSVAYRITPRIISPRCGQQIFVDSIGYNAALTDFSKVDIKDDSVYDLPTKVNLEITR